MIDVLPQQPQYRKPLVWGLPFSPSVQWVSPLTCRVDLYGYAWATQTGLVFLVVENNGIVQNAGDILIKARKLYYVDQASRLGTDCIPGEATRPRVVDGQTRLFCVAAIEVFAMRSVPLANRSRNGLVSWAMITSNPATWSLDEYGNRRPCPSIDNCVRPRLHRICCGRKTVRRALRLSTMQADRRRHPSPPEIAPPPGSSWGNPMDEPSDFFQHACSCRER